MKQLTVQPLAPSPLSDTLANRAVRFTVRQINLVGTLPQRLIGQWRLYLNYCPECNSCAPKLHQCEVCQADTRSYFSWSKEVRNAWWKRYAAKHRIAMES